MSVPYHHEGRAIYSVKELCETWDLSELLDMYKNDIPLRSWLFSNIRMEPAVHRQIGIAAREARAFDEWIRIFDGIADKPWDEYMRELLGDTFFTNLSNMKNALEHHTAAQNLRRENKLQDALREIKMALELFSSDQKFLDEKQEIEKRMREDQEKRNRAEAFFRKAEEYYLAKKHQEALDNIEKALALFPTDEKYLTLKNKIGKLYYPGYRKVLKLNGIEYAFCWCPPGTFLMGSPSSEPGRYNHEKQHRVTLTRGFWMLETEVTQAMWKSVMGTSIRQQHDKANTSWSLGGEGSDYPMYHVSWEECRSFCEKLSEKLGLTVSLPTEAQWEYACRAGTTGAYAGDLGKMGWYDSNSRHGTHPVGQKKPNAWGLYDMHGNVWEWCQDWYDEDYYTESPTSDPTGPNSGSNRVYRGGGWIDDAQDCRSASRNWHSPDYRINYLGFRPVLASPAPGK